MTTTTLEPRVATHPVDLLDTRGGAWAYRSGRVTVEVADPAATRAAFRVARELGLGSPTTPAALDRYVRRFAARLGCGVRATTDSGSATAVPVPGAMRTSGVAVVPGAGGPWRSVTVRAASCSEATVLAHRALDAGSAGSALLSRAHVSGALVDGFDRVLRIGHRIDPLPTMRRAA